MEAPLKQRLIGAAVLAALAIIFLPMLLKGPDVKSPDAAQVPLEMPASPDQKFETRELPLGTPNTDTPAGGVLGMDTSPSSGTATTSDTTTVVTAPAPTPETVSEAAPLESAGAAAPAAPLPAAPAPVVMAPPKAAPAATAAPPTPPVPAAVAGGNYMVSIGSFGNLDNANTLVGKLRAAKLPVSADQVDVNGKAAMRVRIGPFADRAAAESARQRADAIAGSSSKVVALDAAAPKAVATTPAASKPAMEKPAAATTPKASAEAGFAVQLAAPSVEADAMALRDKARGAGFSAFVQRVDTDGGARYRVRVGPVADRSAAGSLLDSVKQKLGVAGIIVANP